MTTDDGLRWVPCEACGGTGEIEVRHRMYGLASCPFPTVDKVCEECHGCGETLVHTVPVTEEDVNAIEQEQPRQH